MRILSLIFLVFLFQNAFSQITAPTATLKGKITDSDDNPIAYASISSGSLSTTSDESGHYILENIKPGNGELTVSSVGYEISIVTFRLKSGETKVVDFMMSRSEDMLQNVEITGRKETGYKNTTTFIGSKIAMADKDIPQSIAFVTKELMIDQGETRVGDVVKNMPGVSQYSFYDDIVIRGFRVNGGTSSTQLFNGLRSITGFWKQSITSYLERIEVIKGPASALYGNASPGGILNRVTKKPLNDPRYSVNFSTGSFNTIRSNIDLTGPANKSKTLLYRLNLGYENVQSFRDLQYDKGYIIAPSISFLPNHKTKINVDFVLNQSNSRLDRGQAVIGDSGIYSVPISRSLNMVNDYLNETNLMFTASLNHQFTKNLQFNIGYLKTGWQEDLLEHRSSNTRAKDSSGKEIPNLVEMQVFIRKRSIYADNVSSYFTWDVNTGKINHKVVAGYDYAQNRTPWGASQLTASGYRNSDNTQSRSYNARNPQNYQYTTVNGIKRPVPNVPHFDLSAANPYQLQDMNNYIFTKQDFNPTFYNIHGIYLHDNLSFWRFKAVFGLRMDFYRDKLNYLRTGETTIEQKSLIPRIGLVFEATKNINLYATWVKGFNPQSAGSLNNPNAGGPFDPEYSQLWEGGVKATWFNNRLAANAAVYRIERNNVLVDANDPDNPDRLSQIGQMLSKGFEFGTAGSIFPNWSITTAYGFNEIFMSKSTDTASLNVRRPNAPKHRGNIWTKYSIPRGVLSGVGFGFGYNFSSKRISDNLNQPLPGYAIADAAVFYKYQRFQIQCNIKNIFNRTYWVGGYDYLRLFPGAPRNWLATVYYTF